MSTESQHRLLIRALAKTLDSSDEYQPLSPAFLIALEENLFRVGKGP